MIKRIIDYFKNRRIYKKYLLKELERLETEIAILELKSALQKDYIKFLKRVK